MRKTLTKKDALIVLLGFMLAGLAYFARAYWSGSQAVTALVYHEEEVIAEFKLDGSRVGDWPVPGKDVSLELGGDKIRFKCSDCPDQVCIHAGWLRKPGDFAACLPNHLSIYVQADRADLETGDVDLVVGK